MGLNHRSIKSFKLIRVPEVPLGLSVATASLVYALFQGLRHSIPMLLREEPADLTMAEIFSRLGLVALVAVQSAIVWLVVALIVVFLLNVLLKLIGGFRFDVIELANQNSSQDEKLSSP